MSHPEFPFRMTHAVSGVNGAMQVHNEPLYSLL